MAVVPLMCYIPRSRCLNVQATGDSDKKKPPDSKLETQLHLLHTCYRIPRNLIFKGKQVTFHLL